MHPSPAPCRRFFRSLPPNHTTDLYDRFIRQTSYYDRLMEQIIQQSKNRIFVIFRRELKNYFNTPIGYVFLVACLVFNFLFFFIGVFNIVPAFWESRSASIRGYMNLLPVTFILLAPAVTMRSWSEEVKGGTIEILRTLPLRDIDLVAGKFFAAWFFVSLLIFVSLPLAVLVWLLGEGFDWGNTFTMYVGSLLMAGAYVSGGLVLSALTREQVVAFILIFLVSVFMFLSNYFIINQHLPPALAQVLGFFSHSYHYSSFSRGTFHLADIFYYISFMGLMLFINVWILRKER